MGDQLTPIERHDGHRLKVQAFQTLGADSEAREAVSCLTCNDDTCEKIEQYNNRLRAEPNGTR